MKELFGSPQNIICLLGIFCLLLPSLAGSKSVRTQRNAFILPEKGFLKPGSTPGTFSELGLICRINRREPIQNGSVVVAPAGLCSIEIAYLVRDGSCPGVPVFNRIGTRTTTVRLEPDTTYVLSFAQHYGKPILTRQKR